MSNQGKFLGLTFLCLTWGFNWVAIKISLEGLPPLISASLRFSLAIIILFFFIKGKRISLRLSAGEFRLLLVTGFMTYTLDYGLIYWGEQYLSAGVTSIFFSTFSLFTALFTHFIFKNETFYWQKYIGIVTGFAGILLVFLDQLILTRFEFKVILASAAIILGAVFAALPTVIIKKHLTQMRPEILSFYQMVAGTFFLVLMGLLTEDIHQVQLSLRVAAALLYMAVMSSAIAFVVYYSLLKNMSAISLSLMIYIIPLVALLGDWLIYRKVLHFRSILGMVIIFAGISLSQGWKRNRH